MDCYSALFTYTYLQLQGHGGCGRRGAGLGEGDERTHLHFLLVVLDELLARRQHTLGKKDTIGQLSHVQQAFPPSLPPLPPVSPPPPPHLPSFTPTPSACSSLPPPPSLLSPYTHLYDLAELVVRGLAVHAVALSDQLNPFVDATVSSSQHPSL